MSQRDDYYRMKKPCDSCPFRNERGKNVTPVRLSEERAFEIAECDGNFPCHKTTVHCDDEDDRCETSDSLHCAGFLIFREKHDDPSQMMRIAERLGLYDRTALDAAAFDEVVDDAEEMIDDWGRDD